MKHPGWSRAGVLRQLSLVARYQLPLRCHPTAVGRRPRSVRRHAAAVPVADLPRMPVLSANRPDPGSSWEVAGDARRSRVGAVSFDLGGENGGCWNNDRL